MKKQHSPYTKKLIKNGVELVTAGLILIAATFAWFALNTKVGGQGMTIKIQEDGKAFKSGLISFAIGNTSSSKSKQRRIL